jgi:hypothetical protein
VKEGTTGMPPNSVPLYSIPDSWGNLDEIGPISPVENPNELPLYPEMLINPLDQRVDQYIDINQYPYQSTAGCLT